MSNKTTVIYVVLAIVILAVIFYSFNERVKNIEESLVTRNNTNNYYYNTPTTTVNVENNIEKIESESVVIGDNNTVTHTQEKTT